MLIEIWLYTSHLRPWGSVKIGREPKYCELLAGFSWRHLSNTINGSLNIIFWCYCSSVCPRNRPGDPVCVEEEAFESLFWTQLLLISLKACNHGNVNMCLRLEPPVAARLEMQRTCYDFRRLLLDWSLDHSRGSIHQGSSPSTIGVCKWEHQGFAISGPNLGEDHHRDRGRREYPPAEAWSFEILGFRKLIETASRMNRIESWSPH